RGDLVRVDPERLARRDVLGQFEAEGGQAGADVGRFTDDLAVVDVGVSDVYAQVRRVSAGEQGRLRHTAVVQFAGDPHLRRGHRARRVAHRLSGRVFVDEREA